MADFKEITTMKYWCQKVLPLVYDDSLSYYEVLNKVVKKLNDLIENNKQLPEYISNLIQEYISSGAIGEVVRNILTDFMLNVKNPPNDLTPAVGDGSADDTEAIQGCIDYASANGGMCVYFPSGSYLTKPLTIKDNVSLFGFDRYNTKLVLRGGATQGLLTGNVEDFSISGMTLDGNMDIQVNNINLIDMNVDSVILSNMVLTDGYTLVRLTVNKILQMDNLVFDYSVVKHMELSGSGSVSANNIYMHDISALKGECLLELQNNNSTFTNMFALGDTPLGYKIAGNNNSISGVIRNATVSYVDTGDNNSIAILGVTERKKMTGDYNVYSNNSVEDVKGNKTINAENIKLNPTQPLEYKEPTPLDEYFKTIPFKHGNENYAVMVKGEKGVKEAIEKEAADRQEADNVLSVAIDNEELARQDADNVLDNKITAEETARQDADNVLDNKITVEETARQDAVNVLDNKIDQEILDRTNADNMISAKIDDLSNISEQPFAGVTRVVKTDNKYNAWANICRTNTGRLIVTYTNRLVHNFNVGTSGKVCYKYSDTAGISWSDEFVMANDETDTYDYSTTSVGVAPNGNIVAILRKRNPTTNKSEYISYISDDNGITFNETYNLSNSPNVNVARVSVPNMTISMDNGKMMFISQTYTLNTYGVFAIFSSDNGVSWTESSQIFAQNNSNANLLPSEIRPTYLGEGRIIAFARNQAGGNLFQLTSEDYGLSWKCELTNISDCKINCAMAVYSKPYDLLALYYTNRDSNTINRRCVKASLVFNSPTSWVGATVLDYTSGYKTKIDGGYSTSCLLQENGLDVITALYTTRGDEVIDDTTPRETGIIVAFDRMNFGDEYKGLNGKYRQALNNSRFDLWDYGESFNSTGMTANRWRLSVGSGASVTLTKETFENGQDEVPYNPKFYAKLNRTVVGSGTTFLTQKIEDVRLFSNGVASYSFYAKTDGNDMNLGVYCRQGFGSGGSSDVTTQLQNKVITSKWTRFAGIIYLPNVKGKTITDNSFLEFNFWLGVASGTGAISITNVQFNAGYEVQEYNPIKESEEILDCQRFAYVMNSANIKQPIGTGFAYNETNAKITVPLPVDMKYSPTVIATPSDWVLTDGVTETDVTSISIVTGNESTRVVTLTIGVTGGLTAFRPYQLVSKGTNRRLILNAEY